MLVERKKNRNVKFKDINCVHFSSFNVFCFYHSANKKKNGPQTRFKNFLLSGFKIFAGVQYAKQYFSKSG